MLLRQPRQLRHEAEWLTLQDLPTLSGQNQSAALTTEGTLRVLRGGDKQICIIVGCWIGIASVKSFFSN